MHMYMYLTSLVLNLILHEKIFYIQQIQKFQVENQCLFNVILNN